MLRRSSHFIIQHPIVSFVRHSSIRIPVVLTTTLPGIGDKGEELQVKKGFARNYLYPKLYAVPATETSRKEYEADRLKIDYVAREKEQAIKKASKRLAAVTAVEITRHIMPNGDLHSPVTPEVICEKLYKQQRIPLTADKITLQNQIKSPGLHTVTCDVQGNQVPLTIKLMRR